MNNLKKIVYDNIVEKINNYYSKYDSVIWIDLKIIFYCFKQIPKILVNSAKFYKFKKVNNSLNIDIIFGAGIGDMLQRSAWLKEFSKLLPNNTYLTIWTPKKKKSLIEELFYKCNYVNRVKNIDDLSKESSDILINFSSMVKIEFANHQKLKQYENLLNFIKIYEKFQQQFPVFYRNTEDYYIKYCLYGIENKQTVLQIVDIGKKLNIQKESLIQVCINYNNYNKDVIDNILNDLYITVSYDVDCNSTLERNVRLWPTEYFEILIGKIKKRYPFIKFIQLGTNRCKEIKGIDVYLQGKTTLNEAKILLKHSILHIDGECGMVHLKHFLNGKSCVLFAQTSIVFKGYDNNINLKSDACPHWCEWIVDDWQTHCIRGYKEPPCMTELKPEYVFENIKPYLDEQMNKKEKNITEINFKDFDFANLNNSKIVFWGKENLELAKTLDKSNQVAVYDYELENEKIKEAKEQGILLEYGDIYNIPEYDETTDIVVAAYNSFENIEFAKKEIARILKNDGKIITKEI